MYDEKNIFGKVHKCAFITPDDLKFYDETVAGWTAESGKFKASIGASSTDICGIVSFELK